MNPQIFRSFGEEMRKQAFLSGMLTAPLKRELAGAAMKRGPETARLKALRKGLAEGDSAEVHHETMPDVGPRYVRAGGKQHVGLRADEDPAVLSHELGHAEFDRTTIGRVLQSPATQWLPMAGRVGGAVAAARGNVTIGMAIAAASALPILAYEGEASRRGIAKLRRAGATEEEVADAKARLLKAWGTYAMMPAELAADTLIFSHLRV